MIPFSPQMFQDDVVFFRCVYATSGQGAPKRTFPEDGIPSKASVQSKDVDRQDQQGRTYTVTVHIVYTPTDMGAIADDKFEWKGRTLVPEGKTNPKGIGDVVFRTSCLETK